VSFLVGLIQDISPSMATWPLWAQSLAAILLLLSLSAVLIASLLGALLLSVKLYKFSGIAVVADLLGFVGLLLLAGMLYVFLPLEFNGGASNFPLIQSFGVFLAAYLLVIFISRDVLVSNHYWTGKPKPKISQLLEVGFLILPLAMPYVLKLMDLKRRNKLKMDYLNYLKNS
jgi:hypothetical protein